MNEAVIMFSIAQIMLLSVVQEVWRKNKWVTAAATPSQKENKNKNHTHAW